MEKTAEVDRERLVRTLQDLVRIDSVNPSLVEGAAGEGKIAARVAGEVRRAGLEVETRESDPGRVSVVARLPGRSAGGRSLMLNAHLDTVGVSGMEDPFSGELRDGRLYGRGAYDMKGGLAACLEAVRVLAESGGPPAGEVVLAAVADEEHASRGTEELVQDPGCRTDGAVVTEPTGLRLCLAHKGFAWMEVRTRGRAAHGSRFREGVDANLRMGRVMAALDRLGSELEERAGHDLLGPPSLHAPLVRGGTGISTYSDRCRLKVERRTLPGETAAEVRGEVEAILEELDEEDPEFDADLELLLYRDAFEVARDADVVRALEGAAAGVLGSEPRHGGEGPWMDSSLLAGAGIETAVFGPDGRGAHADEEWVDVESTVRVAEVLAETARRYCRAG